MITLKILMQTFVLINAQNRRLEILLQMNIIKFSTFLKMERSVSSIMIPFTMLMDMLRIMTEQNNGYLNLMVVIIIIAKNVEVILTKKKQTMKEKGKPGNEIMKPLFCF